MEKFTPCGLSSQGPNSRAGTESPSYAEEFLAGFLIEIVAVVVEGGEEQVFLALQ
jgi:hypothetical protein